jgi:GH15 family glucan-1,4-alpha-glucosidase
MPRPLVVGNGSLLVTLDGGLDLRDLYWPYVGLHNHLSGHRGSLGLWVDGRFSWLSSPEWNRSLGYVNGALVTEAVTENQSLGVTVTLRDTVLHDRDILARQLVIRSHWDCPREARLFFAHDFVISETDIGDTAFYNPFLDAVVHYKRDVYLLLAARSADAGIHEYAIGIKGFGGAEGTWRDAEDGHLSMNAVAQGSVDSTFSVRATLPPCGQSAIRAWICAGKDLAAISELHASVDDADFDELLHDNAHYWQVWSEPRTDATEGLDGLPAPIPEVFRRSLLTIRTNIDNGGAILAANDSDIMETARAHYSYMWPRDGALVAHALDRLGHQEITQRFFDFCVRALPEDRAVLLHKYSADGSWGSTWHPWVIDGEREVPFQQDSTNLVLYSLWNHYQQYRDIEFVQSLYLTFVTPCADFLVAYRNPATGLPLPSYDLWEERRGVHAYTCGTLYGALAAAANLAGYFDDERANTYRAAAAEVRDGMAKYLWNSEHNRFSRRLMPVKDSPASYEHDLTIDSAVHAVFAFGAFPADDPMVVATMRQVVSRLWVQTEVGGFARYEADYYFRRSDDFNRIPGNPWFICTLWAAQWCIAQAKSRQELTTALELLLWAATRAMPSGILGEQLHPHTGEPLSVAPLTWSHAEFISTTLDYLERLRSLPA